MVDKSVLSALRASKAPPKPAEKAPETAAVKARPAAAARPGAKPANLPDAALLNEEAADGETAPAPAGIAAWLAWLPDGRKRWIVLGSGAGGLLGMIAAAALAASHFRAEPPPSPETRVISGRANALDGATLAVDGQTVRLADIDAPPATLICRDGAWTYRCGENARRALDTAIGSAPVECVDPHPDDDGRIAALCRNDTGLDLAAIQVESGWAVNDMRSSSRYIAEESRAENDGNGLWRNNFAHPELWRDPPPPASPAKRR